MKKTICETCRIRRGCNTIDRKRGDPCIQYELDPACQDIKTLITKGDKTK